MEPISCAELNIAAVVCFIVSYHYEMDGHHNTYTPTCTLLLQTEYSRES